MACIPGQTGVLERQLAYVRRTGLRVDRFEAFAEQLQSQPTYGVVETRCSENKPGQAAMLQGRLVAKAINNKTLIRHFFLFFFDLSESTEYTENASL